MKKLDVDYFANNNLSEEEIRENIPTLNKIKGWDYISMYQILSEEFIREFKDKLNWEGISCYQKLSPQFIIEMKDYIEWEDICKHGIITSEIIEKCSDLVDWNRLVIYQKLDEKILDKYWNKLKKYEKELSVKYQTHLSEKFLKKHKSIWRKRNSVISDIILFNKTISQEFKMELLREEKKILEEFIKSGEVK